MRRIVILGAGGNSLEIAETIELLGDRFALEGFLDDDPALRGKDVLGHPVLGGLDRARSLADRWFINGIGSTGTFRRLPEILARTGIPPERFATVVHPTASVSRTAVLGRGVALLQHVAVGVGAVIGDHVVALPSSIVSHESRVGDHTCIAGGACISGRVVVGRCCYLGTNSSIRSGLSVGDGALLGMGAVAVKDVPAGATWFGVPAGPRKAG